MDAFCAKSVPRTLHVFTPLIFMKEESTVPWEKEIKLSILTLESENIGIEGNFQFTKLIFLSTDEENETQKYDMASPHPFG